MKYQSEIIKNIVDTRGHGKSSLHYESECIETWIEEAKGAYPKLTDYQAEWLSYISKIDGGGTEQPDPEPDPKPDPDPEPKPPIGEFPYETLIDVTEATVDNVVPYAYKSAILKGKSVTIDGTLQSVKMPVLTTTGKNLFNPTKMIINDGAPYGYYKYKNDKSVRCTLSLSDKDTSVDIDGIYFGFTEKGNADGSILWLISNGSVVYPDSLAIVSNHNFINIYPNKTEALNKLTERFNIQLEHSEAKTTYEPYKSNILTVNEDVTLRSNGSVHDELDLLTGKLTQRIDKTSPFSSYGIHQSIS